MTTTPDDPTDKFLRDYARLLGVEELTSEALAKSLGLDELTPERLEAWFAREVLGIDDDEPPLRVVQVDREEPRAPQPDRRALPSTRSGRAKRKRG